MNTATYDPANPEPNFDPFMREVEEAITEAATKPYYAPFFLMLKVGQKALIRFLANMNKGVIVGYHERYTVQNGYEVAAVCGRSYLEAETTDKNTGNLKPVLDERRRPTGRFYTGKYLNADGNYDDCVHCLAFEAGEKKLKAKRRFYWPVYVHSVLEKVLNEQGQFTGKWKQVTYKDQQDKDQPMQGLRILEVKGGEQRLIDMDSLYNTLDEPDFTQLEFIMERVTGGTQTKYSMPPKFPTAKSPLRDLPQDLKVPSHDQLRIDVATNKPYKLVSGKTIGDPEDSSEEVTPMGAEQSDTSYSEYEEAFP